MSQSNLAASELEQLAINTIRLLAADMVEEANSGHPGMPMGAAPMAYLLWQEVMRYNPGDPFWWDRDRFVLSAGHGSALLYAMLHLTGYDLGMDQLKRFRQWHSQTPGHPEYGHTPGVEATTGPLGQGFGMGVGMALAERYLAGRYNRPGHEVVGHYTYAIVSDGDLMEGVASEAASLAATLGLGRLIYLYDDNHISIEGGTELAFTEDRVARFKAYGWHTQSVADGNDLAAIRAAIQAAKAEEARPSLIAVRTHIGFGSPKQDTAGAHGEPLGEEALAATRKNFDWPEERFYIPPQVAGHMGQATERGQKAQAAWQEKLAAYQKDHPQLAAEFVACMTGELPHGWQQALPSFAPGDGDLATRAASGKVLGALAPVAPQLVGGSADLAPSTKTLIAGSGDMRPSNHPLGRNIHFGVREHGMGAVVNGMALHGGLIPYGATFLIFSDYMRGSLRLSALMGVGSIWVFTHDSIGLGEDGPTHQPIEHLASLRAMPNMTLIRPADANETAMAWRMALERRDGPTCLALTRQKTRTLDPAKAAGALRGGYVLSGEGAPELIIIASGSEVGLTLEAAAELEQKGVTVRVVSMPSWEVFQEQDQAYQDQVLPPGVTARLAVEAASGFGWERFVGAQGAIVGLDRFGESAPGGVVMDKLGFNVANLVARALEILGR